MQVSVSALFTKSNIPKLARCWIKEPMQMEIKADIHSPGIIAGNTWLWIEHKLCTSSKLKFNAK